MFPSRIRSSRRWRILGAPGLVLALAADAAAEEPPPAAELHGDLRWIGSALTDFPVDAEGTSLGQGRWLDQRLRVGGAVRPLASLALGTEWDLLTGQLAGDVWAVPGAVDARHRELHTAMSLQGVRPRRIAATYTSASAQIEAGLVTSHWGLGLVANDGANDPLFGRSDFGDRVVRLRASRLPQAPGGVIVSGALDWVVDDEIAAFADDQLAFQAIASALAVRETGRLGAYTVFRHQIEADPTRSTDAGVLDLFGTTARPVGDWTLRAGAEAATIVGRTDRALTYEARNVVGVVSFGAVGDAALVHPGQRLELGLAGGFASGDGHPDDGISSDFTFDRDYAVGMVLFDQVLGGVEAATHALLADPRYAGQAPDGADVLVTEGAFRRAVYLMPRVEVRPGPARLAVGVLGAVGTAPYAQPFYSYRGGGTPYNHHDAPSEGRWLGTEVDWRAGIAAGPDGLVSFDLQGGHLWLGRPLRGDGPDLVNLVTLFGRIRW